MLKQAIRLIFKLFSWLCSPILIWFGWCLTLRLSSMRTVVLVPDGTNALFVLMAGIYFPIIAVKYLYFYIAAIAASAVLFLKAVSVSEDGIYVFRLFALVPYWRHRIPQTARFDLYEAWEDLKPTGLSFELAPYGGNPLHLGTSRSAEKLFAEVGGLLEAEGWTRGPLGYERASSDEIPDSA
ncbi:MAG TPA: hypothetical protein VIN58_25930 [Roseateles sp.]